MVRRIYVEPKKEKLPIWKCACGGHKVRNGVQWQCQSPAHDERMAQLDAKIPVLAGNTAPQAQMG